LASPKNRATSATANPDILSTLETGERGGQLQRSSIAVCQFRCSAGLERALMRSRSSVPALAAPQVEHPAEELKGNFPMRRRNLR